MTYPTHQYYRNLWKYPGNATSLKHSLPCFNPLLPHQGACFHGYFLLFTLYFNFILQNAFNTILKNLAGTGFLSKLYRLSFQSGIDIKFAFKWQSLTFHLIRDLSALVHYDINQFLLMILQKEAIIFQPPLYPGPPILHLRGSIHLDDFPSLFRMDIILWLPVCNPDIKSLLKRELL